jgi:hypothetical protein
MPPEVQARFASLDQLRRSRERTEHLLRALLRQRGARFTNTILALAIPPLLLGLVPCDRAKACGPDGQKLGNGCASRQG